MHHYIAYNVPNFYLIFKSRLYVLENISPPTRGNIGQCNLGGKIWKVERKKEGKMKEQWEEPKDQGEIEI